MIMEIASLMSEKEMFPGLFGGNCFRVLRGSHVLFFGEDKMVRMTLYDTESLSILGI